MSKGITIKFKGDRRSQASVTHLFDALLGKPLSPTCVKCGGITVDEGPRAGRCSCAATRWKSCAQWPEECCPAIGNYSDDTHDTKEAAEAVCRLLERRGFGGDGIHFPVRTWVEEVKENEKDEHRA